jgi:hypothetical protein
MAAPHGCCCQAVNLVIGITAQEFAIDIIWEETALSRRAKVLGVPPETARPDLLPAGLTVNEGLVHIQLRDCGKQS